MHVMHWLDWVTPLVPKPNVIRPTQSKGYSLTSQVHQPRQNYLLLMIQLWEEFLMVREETSLTSMTQRRVGSATHVYWLLLGTTSYQYMFLSTSHKAGCREVFDVMVESTAMGFLWMLSQWWHSTSDQRVQQNVVSQCLDKLSSQKPRQNVSLGPSPWPFIPFWHALVVSGLLNLKVSISSCPSGYDVGQEFGERLLGGGLLQFILAI